MLVFITLDAAHHFHIKDHIQLICLSMTTSVLFPVTGLAAQKSLEILSNLKCKSKIFPKRLSCAILIKTLTL